MFQKGDCVKVRIVIVVVQFNVVQRFLAGLLQIVGRAP